MTSGGITLFARGPLEGQEAVFLSPSTLARVAQLRERLPLVQLPGESPVSLVTTEMLEWFDGARDDLAAIGHEQGNTGFGTSVASAAEVEIDAHGLEISRISGHEENSYISWKRFDELEKRP